MPLADLGNVTLNYRIDGAEQASWLVLCNSIGTELAMWDAQIPALAQRFRVLRYDRRGHGGSSTPPGPYAAADLGGDVLALLDRLDITRVSFCGLSIGGLVGQWLALHAPQRIERLVLCSTAAKIGTAEGWTARIEQLRREGMSEIANGAIGRWFTPGYAEREPALIEAVRGQLLHTSVDGYAACCHALSGADFRERLGDIRMPLLTVAGIDDPVTPPSDLRFIAERVPGARSVELPGAHLCNIESAAAFNAALLDFLSP